MDCAYRSRVGVSNKRMGFFQEITQEFWSMILFSSIMREDWPRQCEIAWYQAYLHVSALLRSIIQQFFIRKDIIDFLKNPIFVWWVISLLSSFQIVTPVFLIKHAAILVLVKGVQNWWAFLIAYLCISRFSVQKESKMIGRSLFLNLYTKTKTENLQSSGSRRSFSLLKAVLVLSLPLIFSIILIALF